MAQGKNKKMGKKGAKKKAINPLSRKEWFNLHAPVPFKSDSFGFTCANKSHGTYKVDTAVKGRVVQQLQADLTPGETGGYLWRKIRLIIDEVEGRNAKTSFYGLDTTRDELCYLVKKWKTLIETYCDCRTKDGYILRVFTVAFTKSSEGQKRKTSYALASQVKAIRKKVVEILQKEVNKSDINQILNNFTTEIIHNKIQA
jgi:small subunit ribosomal protein S3Ae